MYSTRQIVNAEEGIRLNENIPESDPMFYEVVETNGTEQPVRATTKIWIASLITILLVLSVVIPLGVWQIVRKREPTCHARLNTDSNTTAQNYSTNADETNTTIQNYSTNAYETNTITAKVSLERPTNEEDFIQFQKNIDRINSVVCEPKLQNYSTKIFLPKDHFLREEEFEPELVGIYKCDENSHCQGTGKRCVSSAKREEKIPILYKKPGYKLVTYDLTVLEDLSCSCASGN